MAARYIVLAKYAVGMLVIMRINVYMCTLHPGSQNHLIAGPQTLEELTVSMFLTLTIH